MLNLRFDASGEPVIQASVCGFDISPCAVHLEVPEELQDVFDEEQESLQVEHPAVGSDWLLSAVEAPSSLTLCLDERFVDVWNEDDALDTVPAGFCEVAPQAEVKEQVQQSPADAEETRRARLNRDFACHFVQAVIDSTLIQAVTGHRRMVTPRRTPATMGPTRAKASPEPAAAAWSGIQRTIMELDTAHLEAAGLAEMEQRLEAAMDLQLSAPPSPAATARPLPSLVPPSPPASPSASSWDVLRLEAGLKIQVDPPTPSPSQAPKAPQQQPVLSRVPSAAAASPALDFEGSGSPLSRPVSRGNLRSSKSHRRIIGGVVRTPAPAESEYGIANNSIERAAAAPAPPAPRPQSRAEPAAAPALRRRRSTPGPSGRAPLGAQATAARPWSSAWILTSPRSCSRAEPACEDPASLAGTTPSARSSSACRTRRTLPRQPSLTPSGRAPPRPPAAGRPRPWPWTWVKTWHGRGPPLQWRLCMRRSFRSTPRCGGRPPGTSRRRFGCSRGRQTLWCAHHRRGRSKACCRTCPARHAQALWLGPGV